MNRYPSPSKRALIVGTALVLFIVSMAALFLSLRPGRPVGPSIAGDWMLALTARNSAASPAIFGLSVAQAGAALSGRYIPTVTLKGPHIKPIDPKLQILSGESIAKDRLTISLWTGSFELVRLTGGCNVDCSVLTGDYEFNTGLGIKPRGEGPGGTWEATRSDLSK